MRFDSAIICLLILVSSSCRKKELQDGVKAEDYIPPVEHCYNNLMDGDEMGLNCGGSCAPCVQIEVPCSNPINEVSIENGALLYTVQSWTVSSFYTGSWDYVYAYRAHLNAEKSIVFYFAGKPSLTMPYYSGAAYDDAVDENICCVRYEFGAGDAKIGGNGQRLYVNYVDGNYKFSGCDMLFYLEGSIYPGTTEYDFNIQVF